MEDEEETSECQGDPQVSDLTNWIIISLTEIWNTKHGTVWEVEEDHGFHLARLLDIYQIVAGQQHQHGAHKNRTN